MSNQPQQPTTATALADEHGEVVQDVLEEMTSVYNTESERIEVQFGTPNCADQDGNWVQINPKLPDKMDPDVEGPNVLRLLDEVLAHEVGHYNWSDLRSKERFADEYPGWGDVPGDVANILEDEFDDARRMREWYGMRSKVAYRAWLTMETDSWTPPVDEVLANGTLTAALVAALHQKALGGYVKYDEELPEEVAKFVVDVAPVIKRVRHQDDAEQRYKLFHVCMQILKRYADDIEDYQSTQYDGNEVTSGERGGGKPAPHASDPEEQLEEEEQEEVEELLEEIEEEVEEGEGERHASQQESEQPEQTPEEGEEELEEARQGESEDEGEAPAAASERTLEIDGTQPEDAFEDKFEVDTETVEKVDTRDEGRWKSLMRRIDEYGTDLEARKRDRDHRASRPYSVRWQHDTVRSAVEAAGIIEELEDKFRELVSRPTPRAAPSGPRMDATNVVRRAAGDVTTRDLFEEPVEVETGDRCIGLATDISGSMRDSMKELKMAGAAIARATEIIGDTFVWEAFTNDAGEAGVGSYVCEGLDLRVVTGPDEDFEWEHLDSFTHEEYEPLASGVRDTRALMEQSDARDYVMLVITDGMAHIDESANHHSDRTAVKQARAAVEECREEGIEVIGVGIGDIDHDDMTDEFGSDGYVMTSVEELAEDIVSLYEQQMDVSR